MPDSPRYRRFGAMAIREVGGPVSHESDRPHPAVESIDQNDLVRPAAGAPPELPLRQALERSTARAHEELTSWLPEAQRLLGATGDPAQLLSLDLPHESTDTADEVIDELLAFHNLHPPRIGFGLDGADPSVSADVRARMSFGVNRVDVPTVHDKVKRGAVVGLTGVDEVWSSAARLAANIESFTWAPARVDLLLLGARGRFTTAADRGTVQVLTPINAALTVTTRSTGRAMLTPGTGALFTHGEDNVIESVDATVLALHFRVQRITIGAVARVVASEARYWPALRADLPFDLDRPVTSYAGSAYDTPEAFAEAWGNVVSSESVERAIARMRSFLPPRPVAPFSASLDWWTGMTPAFVRSALPAGVGIVHTTTEDSTHVLLAGAGLKVAIPADAIKEVGLLLDGESHELPTPPAADAPIARLVRAGFLEATGGGAA